MDAIESYIPTKVIFGAGCLSELSSLDLPGKRALIVTTNSKRAEHAALLKRVSGLLEDAGVQSVVYTGITPNPTKEEVEEARDLAAAQECDFVLGLGGGSCIDAAKAIAACMRQEGDLWDYAYTGTGGKKEISDAAPIVAITTTSGTGTETDPYSVITKTATGEKLDFAADALFARYSIIDPELMLSIPRDQTLFQGLDALFHAAECAITNQQKNEAVDHFASHSVGTVLTWLPVVVDDPDNLEGRTEMAYAADVCSGLTQALINTTSHHIIAQTIGGLFPNVPHGATLIMIADAYYRHIAQHVPAELDHVATFFGEHQVPGEDGLSFANSLLAFFERLGIDKMAMSEYGIKREDLPRIADAAFNRTGIWDVDLYRLSEADVLDILEKSYR